MEWVAILAVQDECCGAKVCRVKRDSLVMMNV